MTTKNEWRTDKPEAGKELEVRCDNLWGEYTIYGMFIEYKPNNKGHKVKTGARFCTINSDTGRYESDIAEWRNRIKWKYK